MSDVSRVNGRCEHHGRSNRHAPGFTPIAEIAFESGAVSGVAVSHDGAVLDGHPLRRRQSLCDRHRQRRHRADGRRHRRTVRRRHVRTIRRGCAYVSSAAAAYDSVLAFDIDANRVVATYPLAYSISDLAVSPDGRRVYAGRTGVDGADVAILDTASGDERAISIAGAGTITERLRLSSDGRRLYVAANAASAAELVVVDAQRNRVLSHIEIGSPIRDIALSPDGATAYVGSCGPRLRHRARRRGRSRPAGVRDHRHPQDRRCGRHAERADHEPRWQPGVSGRRQQRHGAVHRDAGTSSAASRPVCSRHVRSRARTETGCTSPTTPARSPSCPWTRQPPRPSRGHRTTHRPLRTLGPSPTCGRSNRRRLSFPSPSRRLDARGMIATRVGIWLAGPG